MESRRSPQFSRYHPMIPKLYTPAWKIDMKNRVQIVGNCKQAFLPYGPHETTLYLEKRERLCNSASKDYNKTRSAPLHREQQLHPWLHSPLSKYQSSLMPRWSNYD